MHLESVPCTHGKVMDRYEEIHICKKFKLAQHSYPIKQQRPDSLWLGAYFVQLIAGLSKLENSERIKLFHYSGFFKSAIPTSSYTLEMVKSVTSKYMLIKIGQCINDEACES